MPDGAQISGETAAAIGWDAPRHEATPPRHGRSVVPPDYNRTLRNPCDGAGEWLLPWSIFEYPGYRRGMVEYLGRRVTWYAVRNWHRKGRWPKWAAVCIREALASRLARGQEALTQLDAYIATLSDEPARQVGFCVVQEDGKDRRGNWRR